MPNGKTHDKITYITTPFIGLGIYLLFNSDFLFVIILILAYLFASLMFNGDLDTHSKPFNRWWVFKIIWIPYQLLFSHRSVWTHGVIVGTVVRLAYLSPIIIGIILIFNINIQNINLYYLIPILIGLELGNIIHTGSDKIFK